MGTSIVTQSANAIAKIVKGDYSTETDIWLNASDILKLVDDLPAEKHLRYRTFGKNRVDLEQKSGSSYGVIKEFKFPEAQHAAAFTAYLEARDINGYAPYDSN